MHSSPGRNQRRSRFTCTRRTRTSSQPASSSTRSARNGTSSATDARKLGSPAARSAAVASLAITYAICQWAPRSISTIRCPAASRPNGWPGSPGRRDSRNHSTSMGVPNTLGRSPAEARRPESRPSAATVSRARTRWSVPVWSRQVRPATRPSSSTTASASARMRSSKVGSRLAWPVTKSRKSHWGMKAM
jgi:hypothetical protein